MKEKIIHITSGRGPSECEWVVTKLYFKILEDAKKMNLQTKTVHETIGRYKNTLSSVSIKINGLRNDEFENKWKGNVLWIGTSPYRRFHKRKRWFIEVYFYNKQSVSKLKIEDVKYQLSKSSGPGGQHANKTESAVKAIHMESGISVFVQESRSQFQNKKIALERIKKLYARHCFKLLQDRSLLQWQRNINVRRSEPERVYYGPDFLLKEKKND